MKIFLNPGHDRELDSGAVNPNNGAREADVVWNVCEGITNNVQQLLEAVGFEVVSWQSDSLSAVVTEANNWGADYFVSIHCNAFNGVANGTEVEAYSSGGAGAELAKCINDNIVERLGTNNRGVKERPGLYVLKMTDMPSVLVELAFIDNDGDCDLLLNRQHDFALSIVNGICNFLGISSPNDTPIHHDTTCNIAPNGKEYEQNDIDYLINQGYTMAQAKSMLDQDPKYSNTNLEAAAQYADSRVGTTGYGNNGCTAWVREFLLKAGHPLGQLMEDGSQGNLMWVPNLMDWAKANNLWKEADEGGALGDVCLLETNYCREDGPDHVVIACGNGQYWGNSSSRNLIVKSDIAYDYGEENVHGYISIGSGKAFEVVGKAGRSAADIVGDAGSTSYVNLAPNGMVYEENDIQYLLQQGYPIADAIYMLSKDPKYTTPSPGIAPNGKPYEKNDIQYLLNNGYSYEAAIGELSVADKYVA